MTDRIRTLTVILEDDFRDEEEGVEVIMKAIKMIKHVETVHKGKVVDYDQHVASSDFKREVGRLLHDVISVACMGHGDYEGEFMNKIKSASEELRRKRGY